MANIVTNRITFSAASGVMDRERMSSGIAQLTGKAPDDVFFDHMAQDITYGAWDMIDFKHVIPEPVCLVASERKSSDAALGLAILSVMEDVDYFRLREDRYLRLGDDPFTSSDVTMNVQTARDALVRSRLKDVIKDDLISVAEKVFPKAIPAARAMIAAYVETGFFHLTDWRSAKLGMPRQFNDGLFRVDTDGSLSLRFDSVGPVPSEFIAAVAKANPDIMISGAGFDEDNDYAVFFTSGDEHGAIETSEVHNRDGALRAHQIVYGRKLLNSDDPDDDEPENDVRMEI